MNITNLQSYLNAPLQAAAYFPEAKSVYKSLYGSMYPSFVVSAGNAPLWLPDELKSCAPSPSLRVVSTVC
jgi:hypothetical protein